jgi:hypothetical protein
MEIIKIKLINIKTFKNDLFVILKLILLKMMDRSLPPEINTEKEGSSCWDAQIGCGCFHLNFR